MGTFGVVAAVETTSSKSKSSMLFGPKRQTVERFQTSTKRRLNTIARQCASASYYADPKYSIRCNNEYGWAGIYHP